MKITKRNFKEEKLILYLHEPMEVIINATWIGFINFNYW